MKLSDYQKETKPLSLRLISVGIIVSFLVTQLDIQLAFSLPATLPAAIVSPADKHDIHYMDGDLEGFLKGESPLTKADDSDAKKPEEVKQELEAEERVKKIERRTSLSVKGAVSEQQADKAVERDEKRGLVTYSDRDGNSYTVHEKSQRVVETRDVISPTETQIRKYEYKQTQNETLARITTVSNKPDSFDQFEIFSVDASGNLAELKESGILVQGSSVTLKRYGKDAQGHNVLTVYDPVNAYYEAVYELRGERTDESAEHNRLIAYRNVEDGNLTDMSYIYDDDKSKLTVIDHLKNTFEMRELQGYKGSGTLLSVGTVEEAGQNLRLSVQSMVTFSILEREGVSLPIYVFTQVSQENARIVYERLPEGGVGRMLEAYNPNQSGRRVHQEYFYRTNSETGLQEMTIVDYVDGIYMTLELLANEGAVDAAVKPARRLIESGVLDQTAVPPTKMASLRLVGDTYTVLAADAAKVVLPSELLRDDRSVEFLKLRGPPAWGNANSVDLLFVNTNTYQVTHKAALNIQKHTYQVSEYTPAGNTEKYEEGLFRFDRDGAVSGFSVARRFEKIDETHTRVTHVKTGKVEIQEAFQYSEQYSFSYAYELLSQPDIATAVLVDSLTQADMNQLLSLPKEVGIISLFGKVLLFTVSDDSELSLTAEAQELFNQAVAFQSERDPRGIFIAHTHPIKGTGPSAPDIENATDHTEYVVSADGKVFSYNHDGLLGVETGLDGFIRSLNLAVNLADASQKNDESRARYLLNGFIAAMDVYSEAAETDKILFRAGELTEDEEKAFALAEAAFRQSLGLTSEAVIIRGSISSEGDSKYRVPLTYQDAAYLYFVDTQAESLRILNTTNTYADGTVVSRDFSESGRLDRVTATSSNGSISVSLYEYSETEGKFTVTAGTTIQRFIYGTDGEPNTGDDVLLSVTSVNADGDTLTQELLVNGRVSKITNQTKNTVSEYTYSDQEKTFLITASTVAQKFGYGPDKEPGTDDDVFMSVTSVNTDGDRV
ncbi:MAG: hypothetical protein KBC91_02530, partial [Candidatus Omnitrophica bacterium]|nr:hypothetical protein [Candidatus Omnitrophota bacterium]